MRDLPPSRGMSPWRADLEDRRSRGWATAAAAIRPRTREDRDRQAELFRRAFVHRHRCNALIYAARGAAGFSPEPIGTYHVDTGAAPVTALRGVRTPRQRGAGRPRASASRPSAASGDSGSDSGDPAPPPKLAAAPPPRAILTFGCLTPDERGADAEPLCDDDQDGAS